jgi:hypothetical protein
MYGETEGQTDRFQLAGRRHLNNVARQMGMDGQTGRGRRRCRGRYRRTSGIDRLTDRQTDRQRHHFITGRQVGAGWIPQHLGRGPP